MGLLHCCTGALSSCSELGLLSRCSELGLLSRCSELGLLSSCSELGLLSSCSEQASHHTGFSSCAQALGAQGAVAATRQLSSWECSGSRLSRSAAMAHGLSCPQACGILPDQGLSSLKWWADS